MGGIICLKDLITVLLAQITGIIIMLIQHYIIASIFSDISIPEPLEEKDSRCRCHVYGALCPVLRNRDDAA